MDEENAAFVSRKLLLPLKIVDIFTWSTFAIGSVLILIGIISFFAPGLTCERKRY